MITVTRRYRFCASHRLHADSLTEAENQRTFGKCNNPYGHGHDYLLDVSVRGELNAATGLIVRVSELDRFVTKEIVSGFGHRNLNLDIAEFADLVPTTENLALVIAERLTKHWTDYFPYSPARLSGISIQETDRNGFEVLLPQDSAPLKRTRTYSDESVIANA